jgi:hypothetical protein
MVIVRRHNFVVVREKSNAKGFDAEAMAIKEATNMVRDYGGRESMFVYKLHKIVQSKIAPVEIKDVSL